MGYYVIDHWIPKYLGEALAQYEIRDYDNKTVAYVNDPSLINKILKAINNDEEVDK